MYARACVIGIVFLLPLVLSTSCARNVCVNACVRACSYVLLCACMYKHTSSREIKIPSFASDAAHGSLSIIHIDLACVIRSANGECA